MSRPHLDKRRMRRQKRKRGSQAAAPAPAREDRSPAASPAHAAVGEPATDGEAWDLKAALLVDPDSGDAR